jgi:UDP-glucose 4-epimerase
MAGERPAVIVTGSSGLLGHPVCRRLAESGYEVFGFDRVGLPEPPSDLPYVHDIECDLSDYTAVRGAIAEFESQRGKQVASVVHLAAYYDFSGEDSPLYQKVTVEGTDRLLNALSHFDVEQFIFSSTMLVHSPVTPGAYIDEQSPQEAKWPYPQSKIATEKLIREAHRGVRSLFLRVAGVYTDWGTQPTLVQQIKRIYESDFESHFFPGDDQAGQSAVYLDDAVQAIVASVERRTTIPPTTAILIGEPEPPSYATLQDAIARAIHGSDWSTFYVPPAIAEMGAKVIDTMQGGEAFIKPFMVAMADDHYALDIHRAQSLLSWEPSVQMLDVLPTIISNLRDNPQEWYARNGLGKPQTA